LFAKALTHVPPVGQQESATNTPDFQRLAPFYRAQRGLSH